MTDHRGRLLVAARGFATLSALPMTLPAMLFVRTSEGDRR